MLLAYICISTAGREDNIKKLYTPDKRVQVRCIMLLVLYRVKNQLHHLTQDLLLKII